jgi:hypothetical protein
MTLRLPSGPVGLGTLRVGTLIAAGFLIVGASLAPPATSADPASQGAVVEGERFPTVDHRTKVAPSAEFDHLETLARGAGSVRAIVGLRVAFTPEGALSPAAVAAQRRAIARATAAVLQALSGTDHRIIHSYEFVPLIALELSTGALTRLRSSDLAATLWNDTPRPPPTLAQGADMRANEAPAVGRGGAVAILDTGVDGTDRLLRRPDGSAKVVSEACFTDGNCPSGGDRQFGAGAGGPCDYAPSECRHGTHVVGMAAGRGIAGAGANIDGVAPGADIIAIQVFSRFTGAQCDNAADDPCALSYESDQIAGLQHVFRLRGTFAIGAASLSRGSGLFDLACDGNPLKLAIDNLRSVGISTVIASGSDSVSNAVNAPGCISTAMTVDARERSDEATTVDRMRSGKQQEPLPDYVVTAGAATFLPKGRNYTFRNETGNFKWSHTTKNVGEEDLTTTKTGLKLGNATTSPVLDDMKVSILKLSGNTTTPVWDFKSFDYGTYTITVCADHSNKVDENDDNNNCKELTPFHIVPKRLEGKVTGTWPVIEGATVSWEGTLTFDFKIHLPPSTFVYARVAGSLKFTLSGTTGGCTWSGKATHKPSENAKVVLKFPGQYMAENVLPKGFRIPGSLICPPPAGTTRAPINMGGEWWMDTGGWRDFKDPGLMRLKDEFNGTLTKFTWDLEASG